MECALLSAGATVDLVENVVTDKLKNGLAIIRSDTDYPIGVFLFSLPVLYVINIFL